MKFKEYVDLKEYFDNLYDKLNQNKSSLLEIGMYGVKHFVCPTVSNRELIDISPDDLLDVYRRMRYSGYGEETIRRINSALKKIFGDAKGDGLIVDDPTRYIKMEDPSEIKEIVFSPKEMKTMLGFIKKSKYKNIYLFVLYSGISFYRTIGISDNDVKWDKGKTSVKKRVNELHGRVILSYIQDESALVDFYLSKIALKVLEDEIKIRKQNKEKSETWHNNENLIFCKGDGSLIRPRSLIRELKVYGNSKIKGFEVKNLHRQFQYGIYEDLFLQEEETGMKNTDINKKDFTCFSDDELACIKDALKENSYGLEMSICLNDGIQIRHVLGLNVNSLDFENKRIIVRKSISYKYEKPFFKVLKHDEVYPMSLESEKSLKEHISNLSLKGDDLLFKTKDNLLPTRGQIRRATEVLLIKSRVPLATPRRLICHHDYVNEIKKEDLS